MASKSRKPRRTARDAETQRARFVAAPGDSELPADYGSLLTELKQRIREERLRVVTAANAAMVLSIGTPDAPSCSASNAKTGERR